MPLEKTFGNAFDPQYGLRKITTAGESPLSNLDKLGSAPFALETEANFSAFFAGQKLSRACLLLITSLPFMIEPTLCSLSK